MSNADKDRKSPDVVCFGDLLMDFVPTESGLAFADLPTFVPVPGGAAANVAVGLAKLGRRSAFMGKVGDEPFGHVLVATSRRKASTPPRSAWKAKRAPRSPSSPSPRTASATSCSTDTPRRTCCSCRTRSTAPRSSVPQSSISTRSASPRRSRGRRPCSPRILRNPWASSSPTTSTSDFRSGRVLRRRRRASCWA
ncbi:MAG: hypothetical protein HC871_02130 [Rhizobiales bacterium]|nr:hypothetical protein [Hyphomicrobiales bacterium]